MKPFLIIPVENQVRELDAKLLVAVLAAQEGWTSIIGAKWCIHQRIGRFPPSIYIAKSLTERGMKMLHIIRRIGHYIIAWDEEAVAHYAPDIYYARRVAKDAFDLIDLLVAWGEDNRDLFYGHPACRREAVRVLGNPRADILRPEMRQLFQDRVDELQREHGNFILFNTNFNHVNGYHDTLNLLYLNNGEWVRGHWSLGMPDEFARGLFHYKRVVFEAFQALIPAVARAFPDRRIVLRPHPSENHDFWRTLLAEYPNVVVRHEGNVVPWLMACDCLIQCGCTTAVEGFLLGTRIVSFTPVEDPRHELRLPNELGTRCRTADEVIAAIRDPDPDLDPGGARRRLVGRFIHGFDNGLASARLIKLLPSHSPYASFARIPLRLSGIIKAELRTINRRRKQRSGSPRHSVEYNRQRFPRLEVSALQEHAERLRKISGAPRPVEVRYRHEDIFEVRARE
ncbi:surface carbohydrate biosynthesis protein [Candidatus Methylomirabilis sp.]|uniref:surface carbohydrate biosynthesis protein n=1 Tax=Candidatus Methylomirabilis sp. TaxID=2032687 RepID=UPI003C777450